MPDVSFFADFNADDPLREPKFDADGIVQVSLADGAVFQITAFIPAVLGYEPDMPDAPTLQKLARRVLRAGAGDQAILLLEAHEAMVTPDVDLCLLLADCHKQLCETKSELVALERAYKADMSRWQTLVRIFWCASHCDGPAMACWALSVLEQEFPDRYENFASNHEWVRFVA